MTIAITAFIVRETNKHIYAAPKASYISISDMLTRKAKTPKVRYMKIAKDLIVSRRVTHTAMHGDAFLTTSEVGRGYVDMVIRGEEIVFA